MQRAYFFDLDRDGPTGHIQTDNRAEFIEDTRVRAPDLLQGGGKNTACENIAPHARDGEHFRRFRPVPGDTGFDLHKRREETGGVSDVKGYASQGVAASEVHAIDTLR